MFMIWEAPLKHAYCRLGHVAVLDTCRVWVQGGHGVVVVSDTVVPCLLDMRGKQCDLGRKRVQKGRFRFLSYFLTRYPKLKPYPYYFHSISSLHSLRSPSITLDQVRSDSGHDSWRSGFGGASFSLVLEDLASSSSPSPPRFLHDQHRPRRGSNSDKATTPKLNEDSKAPVVIDKALAATNQRWRTWKRTARLLWLLTRLKQW